MIIMSPKMYFESVSKTKSLSKAKTNLIKKFNLVDQVNKDTGEKQKFQQRQSDTKGNVFVYDFMLDNPVGITFNDLFEIYNSIPQNLMTKYKELLQIIEDYDPDCDTEEEDSESDKKIFYLNMKKQEYEGFIEKYLNDIRDEAEAEKSEAQKLIET